MGLTRYTVCDGDTIHQVARRLLGNADQWIVLAEFNKLDYPYIDTSGTPYPGKTVLATGSTLLVQDSLGQRDQTFTGQLDLPDLYEVLLGRDIALSLLGDLQPNEANGDLLTVGGIENLIQALQHRIDTRKGDLAYHPEYGTNIEQYIGQANDAVRLRLIRVEITQTLLADPRIKSIRQVLMDDGVDHVDVRVTAEIIGQDDVVPLNLVIRKAA